MIQPELHVTPHLPACCHRGNPFRFSSAFSVDCLVPDCSGNGVCVAGRCVCFKGHQGSDCTLPTDMTVNICVNCSGHGVYDYSERVCRCEDGWGGATCQLGRCREGRSACVVSFRFRHPPAWFVCGLFVTVLVFSPVLVLLIMNYKLFCVS